MAAIMNDLHVRTVYFVSDAVRALDHYTKDLGFTQDWTYEEQGRVFVFQVSLFSLQLILNQAEDSTRSRVGQGRIFMGLNEEQLDAICRHIHAHRIATRVTWWGRQTLQLADQDGNDFYFWLPNEAQNWEEELARPRG
jgi:catechol 2,3-dioxygenase-like lactoylglutathione lyase family enzyme